VSDTLFDPDVYGPGRKPRKQPVATNPLIEPFQEPWELMRRRDGVAPYFHMPRTRNMWGATVAMCGLQGPAISNVGVDQMIRCPVCVVALDMRP
jgi:hypothetical protein